MKKIFLSVSFCLISLFAFSQTAWEITWDLYSTRYQGLLLVDNDNTGLLRVNMWNLYNGAFIDMIDQDVITRKVYDGVVINCYNPRTAYGTPYVADNFKIFNSGIMYMQDDAGNWSTAIVMYQITTSYQLDVMMRKYGLK